MQNILKAIGAGLALGGALFLMPFLGRLILFVGLLRVAFRLLRSGRRGTRAGRWAARGNVGGPSSYSDAPLPIDNQWYRPGLAASGPASYVAIS